MAVAKKPVKIFSTTRNVVVAKAVIRPPTKNQVDDVLEQVRIRVKNNQRVLVTTLTKKFAEELDIYFKGIGIKSAYIHSDVETLDRLDILADLRRGRYDVLIGINLLREGLDLPEVALVAIFDADKEGFLRSKTSLIQIVGRAARHSEGKVIMYGDTITDSMRGAIEETEARRLMQQEYNKKHGITPKTTTRELQTIADDVREEVENDANYGKAGAILTPGGFVEAAQDWEMDNNYSRRKLKTDQNGRAIEKPKRAKQVFDDFDAQKMQYKNDLNTQDLSVAQLKSKLSLAIDALDFEMAAAIRDILAAR
jgi:excinuclease ABC subunit B